MQVKVKKSQADYFRRLALKEARATGKEIQAYLIGRVVSPNLTVIDEFRYTKEYGSQTTGEVCWYKADVDELIAEATAAGQRVLGDCHSHPNWDAVLSPDDYKKHIEDGQRITGICSIQNNRTRLRFWMAESALAAEIIYV